MLRERNPRIMMDIYEDSKVDNAVETVVVRKEVPVATEATRMKDRK